MAEEIVSAQDYFKNLENNLSLLEKMADGLSGGDERLDLIARILLQQMGILKEGLKFQLPGPVAHPELSPYSVRTFDLSTAQENLKVQLSGDQLTFFSSGSLENIEFSLDSPVNDKIEPAKFNPLSYAAKFEKFYLTWSAQDGETLTIIIGREQGASAGVQKQLVDVVAQTIGNLAVNITAQDLAEMVINVAAQSVGIYLQPEWAAKESYNISMGGTASGKHSGEGLEVYYPGSSGEIVYLTGASFCIVDPSYTTGYSVGRFEVGRKDKVSGDFSVDAFSGGGLGGMPIYFSQPMVINCNTDYPCMRLYNYCPLDSNMYVSAWGYITGV